MMVLSVLVPDQKSVGATLEPVFLVPSQFFDCWMQRICFRIGTSPEPAPHKYDSVFGSSSVMTGKAVSLQAWDLRSSPNIDITKILCTIPTNNKASNWAICCFTSSYFRARFIYFSLSLLYVLICHYVCFQLLSAAVSAPVVFKIG